MLDNELMLPVLYYLLLRFVIFVVVFQLYPLLLYIIFVTISSFFELFAVGNFFSYLPALFFFFFRLPIMPPCWITVFPFTSNFVLNILVSIFASFNLLWTNPANLCYFVYLCWPIMTSLMLTFFQVTLSFFPYLKFCRLV